MRFTPKRLAGVAVLLIVLLLAVGIYSVWQSREAVQNRALRYYEDLPAADPSESGGMTKDFWVTEEFRSNLPVLVLQPEGDLRNGATVSLAVYRESPFGEAEEAVAFRIGIAGDESEKPDYILTPSGKDRAAVLGMPEGSAFRLYAEASDLNLIRSYVGIRTVSEVMEYAPRSAFCELLLKDGDGYRYEGVYRFAETVTAEENRVEIAGNRAGNEKNGFMIRRGEKQEDALPLETWAGRSGRTGIPLWTYSPLSPDTDAVSYMETCFSDLERVICGEGTGAIDEVVDTRSFIDYYLLNEYFGNRDAGKNVYYIVDWQGKLRMGPVTSFEHAMNSPAQPEKTHALVMADSDFYRDLMRDGDFLRAIQGRYVELRQTILKEDTVYRKINEAIAYLAAARERNALRWGRVTRRLAGGEYDEMQDLYRMKTYLSEHGKSISEHLVDLIEADRVANEGKGGNTVFFVMSLLLFLIPCILVNRRG